MNNDIVIVKILRDKNNGKKCEGEITRIVDRKNTKLVGTYEDNKNFGFVVPDDKRIFQDIFISKENKNGAKNGEVVSG